MAQFDLFGTAKPAKARKAPKARGPANAPKARKPAKAKRPKVTPCETCKGFDIPGRTVPSVARGENGRFKRRQR